jgi:hypothetical protein
MASRKRLRDWGRPPGRSAEVRAAVAEAPKQVPGRKDTRRWCHGKEGREHVPQIVCHGLYGRVCQWAERWISDGGIHWHCEHRETFPPREGASVKAVRWLICLLDEALDQIPAYEDGRWFRHGQWGCQLRLSRFWLPKRQEG